MDKKKKPSFWLAAWLAGMMVIFPGCQKGLEVTSADAKEVALDDAGYTEAQVTGLESTQTDDGFTVDFTANGRNLQYEISSRGIIQSRTIEKEAGAESQSANEAETSAASSGSEVGAENASAAQDTVDHDLAAIALASQSLEEKDVSNLQTSQAANRGTVTFDRQALHYSIVVDLPAGQVIATSIQ